jgi:hypothetical protein
LDDDDDDDAETFSEEKKEVNFSPTLLAPVSRDDHAAFAPSRSCSPVRSIFSLPLCVFAPTKTSAEQLYSPTPRPICRLRFCALPAKTPFPSKFLFQLFAFLFHLAWPCSEISGGAGRKRTGRATPSTQTTANTEKEGGLLRSQHFILIPLHTR